MITSSSTNSAPYRAHSSWTSSRNPGRAGTRPMFAGNPSAITAATRPPSASIVASSRSTSFQGTTSVSAACALVTPGEAGMPWVARPEPASASKPSTCP